MILEGSVDGVSGVSFNFGTQPGTAGEEITGVYIMCMYL